MFAIVNLGFVDDLAAIDWVLEQVEQTAPRKRDTTGSVRMCSSHNTFGGSNWHTILANFSNFDLHGTDIQR